jgi:hypothetical protein
MTMTMDNDTITTTTNVMVPPQVMASIHSLIAFAESPRGSITPVITGLRATRTGETQLTVVSTNRYVAAMATYDNVEFSNWDNDPQFWIDPVVIKQAATVSKANGLAMVSFGYDDNTEDSFIAVGDTRFTYRQCPNSYPAVDRLFDGFSEPNGATTVSLKIQWFVALSKVVMPETRPDKDRPWLFSLFHDEDGGKPRPVLATMSGDDYAISVLIQPNLIVR